MTPAALLLAGAVAVLLARPVVYALWLWANRRRLPALQARAAAAVRAALSEAA